MPINLNKKKIILLILLFLSSFLSAEVINLKISYLGITGVNVISTLNRYEDFSKLHIEAKSTFVGNIFNRLDNTYSVTFDKNFLPLIYTKSIRQRNIQDTLVINFDHQNNYLTREYLNNSKEDTNFEILPYTREFFVTLYYLRKNLETAVSESLFVEANNNIWEISAIIKGFETISSIFGKTEAIKVRIQVNKKTDREIISSDILTNNLINPDNILYFWFTNDEKKIPIKAEYERNPFSVYWEITSYEE